MAMEFIPSDPGPPVTMPTLPVDVIQQQAMNSLGALMAVFAAAVLIFVVGGYCWMCWEGRNAGHSHELQQQELARQVRELRRKQRWGW